MEHLSHMPYTCSLDYVDENPGRHSDLAVATILGVTRQRIGTETNEAMAVLKHAVTAARIVEKDDE